MKRQRIYSGCDNIIKSEGAEDSDKCFRPGNSKTIATENVVSKSVNLILKVYNIF